MKGAGTRKQQPVVGGERARRELDVCVDAGSLPHKRRADRATLMDASASAGAVHGAPRGCCLVILHGFEGQASVRKLLL